MKPIVSKRHAGICTIIALVIGLILTILGYGYHYNWQGLTGGKDLEAYRVASGICITVAFSFTILGACCILQVALHGRKPRDEMEL
ncbi:hypothetical protein M407DRAFT_169004 [Tulasnella calospora MUT 4182]|uniref:Uncharacterized protein n=1 Tax=Tulasnella calospora MUT 4182 TaxID=1051891 RepID=A0A0C3Q3L6_9AGAM|nr:hypothetical protein M407DRAFT_169004 [Tulasnella calospora MUT 4182]